MHSSIGSRLARFTDVHQCPWLVGCSQRCAMTAHYNRFTFFGENPMSSTQNDNQPVVWAVLVAVIVLAVGLAIGFGIAKSKKAAPAAPVAAAAAPADAASEAASAAPAASEAAHAEHK